MSQIRPRGHCISISQLLPLNHFRTCLFVCGSVLGQSPNIPCPWSPGDGQIIVTHFFFLIMRMKITFTSRNFPSQAECPWLSVASWGQALCPRALGRRACLCAMGLFVIRTTRPAAAVWLSPYQSAGPGWILLIAECCWSWQIQETVYMAT